eukprot:Awhi_evm1s14570
MTFSLQQFFNKLVKHNGVIRNSQAYKKKIFSPALFYSSGNLTSHKRNIKLYEDSLIDKNDEDHSSIVDKHYSDIYTNKNNNRTPAKGKSLVNQANLYLYEDKDNHSNTQYHTDITTTDTSVNYYNNYNDNTKTLTIKQYTEAFNSYLALRHPLKALEIVQKIVQKQRTFETRAQLIQIIQSFFALHMAQTAIKFFDSIRLQPSFCDSHTWLCFITLLIKNENRKESRKYFQAMKDILPPNVDTYIHLISFCSKIGDMTESTHYFLEAKANTNIILNEDIYYWMIRGFSFQDQPQDSFRYFEEMKELGLRPTERIYTTLLTAVHRQWDLEKTMAIVEEMTKKLNFFNLRETYVQLILIFCQTGNLKLGAYYLEEMQRQGFRPNLTCYNNLIDGFSKKGDLDNMMLYFRKLIEASDGAFLQPNVDSYNSLIDGWGKRGHLKESLKYFYEMKHKEIRENERSYYKLIHACFTGNNPSRAECVLQEMKQNGFYPNFYAYHNLAYAYGILGDTAKQSEYEMKYKTTLKGSVYLAHALPLLMINSKEKLNFKKMKYSKKN